MKVVIDIEANGLENPTKVWVIVLKDIDTGELHVFRTPSDDEEACRNFKEVAAKVDLWIGHNILEYDFPVLSRLLAFPIPNIQHVIDTLIISRMAQFVNDDGTARKHSIDAYGKEFGSEKIKFSDWSKYSLEMEEYCIQDVHICHRVYTRHSKFINTVSNHDAIQLEHSFQRVVNALHDNGFAFNVKRATDLLSRVKEQLEELDHAILAAFPPRTELVKVYTPRLTKHGTISRTSVPRGENDLSAYQEGAAFSRLRWREFNPASHKQLIEVLDGAGWKPIDKTDTHTRNRSDDRRDYFLKYGWKINETNLSTLPDRAPKSARLLAKRILHESRRRTLTEWLGLVQGDGRIHGKFQGIGAWTHRMSHQKPNMANIPNEFREDGSIRLLGKELRSLWIAPRRRLLIGCDAEGIQLRVFAHIVNDPLLIKALVNGDKKLKTDPHSYNRRVLNGGTEDGVCRTRLAAKRFLYALFLGAGLGKLAFILGTSEADTKVALANLLKAYPGFEYVRRYVIPKDARNGYFIGLDGRAVPVPGEDYGEKKHLMMSGYLQNGEAIIMKKATLKFEYKLGSLGGSCLVDMVHDEWQTEGPNDVETAVSIAKIQAESLEQVGVELGLNCPLSGSYWNDDHHDYTIGTNWYQTH